MTIPYAGLGLDRATDRRGDPAWVAARAADGRAQVWPLWRDQSLVAGDPPVPVTLAAGETGSLDPGVLVLLGLDGDVAYFTADLSDLTLADALARTGADAAADIRTLFSGLPADQARMLAYARGLLYWGRQQRYCGRCGSAAELRHAGHLRVCTNGECGALIFPRIEPAVITLVETSTRPRRCLLARHRASTAGRYSLLAGFLELGESLEDAVRREIFEEGPAWRCARSLLRLPALAVPGGPDGRVPGHRRRGVGVRRQRRDRRGPLVHPRRAERVRTGPRSARPRQLVDRVLLAAWLAEDE